MRNNKWDIAYSNTKVIKVYEDTWQNCCKDCGKVTDTQPTREMQQLGNVIQNIVGCTACLKTFVNESTFGQFN